MSAEISIRRATAEDAESISALSAEVQQLHRDHDAVTYRPPDATLTVPMYRSRLSSSETVAFLAEDACGDAVGYVVTVARAAEESSLTNAAQFVELIEIGVATQRRGRGIGQALHDRVVCHWAAAGATEIRLTVIAFNAGARRFYERLGFVEVSRRMAMQL
jgi:ribosomal protein S18 acetylase RimI-like enzyme